MVHDNVGCAALPSASKQDWEQGCGITAVPLACVYVQGEPAVQPNDQLLTCKASLQCIYKTSGTCAR